MFLPLESSNTKTHTKSDSTETEKFLLQQQRPFIPGVRSPLVSRHYRKFIVHFFQGGDWLHLIVLSKDEDNGAAQQGQRQNFFIHLSKHKTKKLITEKHIEILILFNCI